MGNGDPRDDPPAQAPSGALPRPADETRRCRSMRIPYIFGALPVIGDDTRTVARRAATFILGALINNTLSVAFRADFFSHCAALVPPEPETRRSGVAVRSVFWP
jgi:hypothetical protein